MTGKEGHLTPGSRLGWAPLWATEAHASRDPPRRATDSTSEVLDSRVVPTPLDLGLPGGCQSLCFLKPREQEWPRGPPGHSVAEGLRSHRAQHGEGRNN